MSTSTPETLKPCRNCGQTPDDYCTDDDVYCDCGESAPYDEWQAATGRERAYLARAQEAEAGRDVLANALNKYVAFCPPGAGRAASCGEPFPCPACWIEWAADEAAKTRVSPVSDKSGCGSETAESQRQEEGEQK